MIEIVYQKFYIFFDFKGKLVAKRSEKLQSIKKIDFDDEDYKETINKIKQAQNDLSLLERDWIDLEEKTLENNK